MQQNPALREERLYFFQFPAPFPSFVAQNDPSAPSLEDNPEIDDAVRSKATPEVKSEGMSSEQSNAPELKVDGVIGELVVYRSGAVKMKLANGIVLDVRTPKFMHQRLTEYRNLTLYSILLLF